MLIGAQAAGTAGSRFVQYVFDTPGIVSAGDRLEIDTINNVVRAGEFDGRCASGYF